MRFLRTFELGLKQACWALGGWSPVSRSKRVYIVSGYLYSSLISNREPLSIAHLPLTTNTIAMPIALPLNHSTYFHPSHFPPPPFFLSPPFPSSFPIFFFPPPSISKCPAFSANALSVFSISPDVYFCKHPD